MKVIAKVFSILSAVLYGLIFVGGFVSGIVLLSNDNIVGIAPLVGSFVYAVLTVFAIVAIKKTYHFKNKRDLVVWGVVTLLLVNVISGIFMLIVSDGVYDDETSGTCYEVAAASSSLVKVKELYDAGILTKEEYEQKRAKYAANI